MTRARESKRIWTLICAVLVPTITALAQPVPAHPRASCGPGDRVEPGLQGQVPVTERLNGSAVSGYWCNLELVGEYPSRSFGNFDTYANCAYYSDNYGFFPGSEGGGVVLDVSNPAKPVKTAYLTSRAMGNAGESLRVNQARGLLVASYYNVFSPDEQQALRWLAVYSVREDCAHPKLLAEVEMPSAVGHGGCFQPDGFVYYMAGQLTITPIDLTDPTNPKQLSDPWPFRTHNCSISDDGTRGYFASNFGELSIVDTSEAQERVPGAHPRLISTFPTLDAQAQEGTVPVSYGGHPYVILWSEVRVPPKVCLPLQPTFAYPRIIDLADETHPTETSKLQTEVVLPENCPRVAADATVKTNGVDQADFGYPLASALFLYDSHMCTPDRLKDPTILACAQLGSGLRIWDIRDPRAPKEIAYYNTGTVSESDSTHDWAAARPVIRRDLGQVWWVTMSEGFHVASFRDGVWPFPGDPMCPPGYDYFRAQYDLKYQACKTATAVRGSRPHLRPQEASPAGDRGIAGCQAARTPHDL